MSSSGVLPTTHFHQLSKVFLPKVITVSNCVLRFLLLWMSNSSSNGHQGVLKFRDVWKNFLFTWQILKIEQIVLKNPHEYFHLLRFVHFCLPVCRRDENTYCKYPDLKDWPMNTKNTVKIRALLCSQRTTFPYSQLTSNHMKTFQS